MFDQQISRNSVFRHGTLKLDVLPGARYQDCLAYAACAAAEKRIDVEFECNGKKMLVKHNEAIRAIRDVVKEQTNDSPGNISRREEPCS